LAENQYQGKLIKKIKRRFPCEVLKNDPNYIQGILDLTLLFEGGFWATLEVKDSATARVQPNQDYYVQRFDDLCFAAYIYPENEDEVLNALQQAYEASRRACIPEPK
jgi:hypothetical protein